MFNRTYETKNFPERDKTIEGESESSSLSFDPELVSEARRFSDPACRGYFLKEKYEPYYVRDLETHELIILEVGDKKELIPQMYDPSCFEITNSDLLAFVDGPLHYPLYRDAVVKYLLTVKSLGYNWLEYVRYVEPEVVEEPEELVQELYLDVPVLQEASETSSAVLSFFNEVESSLDDPSLFEFEGNVEFKRFSVQEAEVAPVSDMALAKGCHVLSHENSQIILFPESAKIPSNFKFIEASLDRGWFPPYIRKYLLSLSFEFSLDLSMASFCVPGQDGLEQEIVPEPPDIKGIGGSDSTLNRSKSVRRERKSNSTCGGRSKGSSRRILSGTRRLSGMKKKPLLREGGNGPSLSGKERWLMRKEKLLDNGYRQFVDDVKVFEFGLSPQSYLIEEENLNQLLYNRPDLRALNERLSKKVISAMDRKVKRYLNSVGGIDQFYGRLRFVNLFRLLMISDAFRCCKESAVIDFFIGMMKLWAFRSSLICFDGEVLRFLSV
jgi:hypothetical protein